MYSEMFKRQQVQLGLLKLRLEALDMLKRNMPQDDVFIDTKRFVKNVQAAKGAIAELVQRDLGFALLDDKSRRVQISQSEIDAEVARLALISMENLTRYDEDALAPGWLALHFPLHKYIEDPGYFADLEGEESEDTSMIDRALMVQLHDYTRIWLMLGALQFAAYGPGESNSMGIDRDVYGELHRDLHLMRLRIGSRAFELGMLTEREDLRQRAITIGLGFYEPHEGRVSNPSVMDLVCSMGSMPGSYMSADDDALRRDLAQGIERLRSARV